MDFSVAELESLLGVQSEAFQHRGQLLSLALTASLALFIDFLS